MSGTVLLLVGLPCLVIGFVIGVGCGEKQLVTTRQLKDGTKRVIDGGIRTVHRIKKPYEPSTDRTEN
jgi:hypothetical protein